MPEEENKTVPIDTSGPDEEVVIEEKQETVSEDKPEIVVEETTEQETESKETLQEGGEAKKEETKKDDEQLEEYSKGVQSRIAKLTRKMREAERREAAAVEYANALEQKRKLDQERFNKVDSEYNTKFAESVKSEMESVQKPVSYTHLTLPTKA